MTDPKIQHYVPKFLLRNFGTGKKDQVWVFDKRSGRPFATNAKNIASESRFYDFEMDGAAYSLESDLSRLESKAKPVVDQILTQDTTKHLSAEQRGTLAAFLAVQFVRTRAFRAQWADFPNLLKRKIEALKLEPEPGSDVESLIQVPSENQVKIDNARMLLSAPKDFGPRFLDKRWFIAATTPAHPFWIGDNPVALQNHVDMGPYGNLGLSVRGIEIYMPLSSTRALGMWCPSLVEQFEQGARTIQSTPRHLVDALVREPDRMLAIAAALKSGGALPYEPRHVTNFNSLQVIRSERYVVSPTNEFELVRRMLNEHPEFREGQRMVDATAPS